MNREASLKELKGVGEKTAEKFAGLKLYTVGDLLSYYPRAYLRYEKPVPAVSISEETEFVTVAGYVQKRPVVWRGANGSVTTAYIKDQTGTVTLLWFRMPFLTNTLLPGSYYLFWGRVQMRGRKPYLIQPQMFTPAAYEEISSSLQPLYALTKGVSNKLLTKTVKQAMDAVNEWEDTLPSDVIAQYHLCTAEEAIAGIHFPKSEEMLQEARKRIVFEELFEFLFRLQVHKRELAELENRFVMRPDGQVECLLRELPFALTDDQKKAWNDICRDFAGPRCMHRMLQGDVGSGKTIIALLGCFTAAANGYQSVIMAPTEVLAKQHFETVSSFLETYSLPYRAGLLTGSLSAKEKRSMQESIALGQIDIVIGTHAVIQDKVSFCRLAFAVTDEQHRFGVKQREALSGKGYTPHILVMSATPIPRTLARLLYADLDISVIRQMPANRIPIKNCVIHQEQRQTAWKFILKEVEKGRQAYIVCPMIEESEQLEGENVLAYTANAKKWFPAGIRIGMLHGRMKPAEKNEIMEQFADKRIDILISTTVIEVGIDVPNATVMMIENADRFGLSQLHQLRGRVGRGAQQSYCIFINASKKAEAAQRLDILNHTNDGFEVAEKDLQLRGPGELSGIRQSGELMFKVADVIADMSVLYQAKEAVEDLLAKDPDLSMEANQFLKDFAGKAEESWNL